MLFFVLMACGPDGVRPPVVPTQSGDADTALPPLDDTDAPTTDDADPPDGADLPPAPNPSCTLGPHAESFTIQVQHGGFTRSALVDLPPGYDGTEELPMVLNFHGMLMDGALQRSYTSMAVEANDRGWIAVHPDGIANSWNVTPFTSDVGFVEELLDALDNEVCVDPSRTYATGLSMGGYFSYMLGCELSGRFAAIAPVAGLDANVFCSPNHTVPLLHIHGTSDHIVPHTGSILSPSAENSVAGWADDVNSCNAAPVVTFDDGVVTCETRSCGPDDEATLCLIDGGEHAWPGAPAIPLLMSPNDHLDATTEVLDFFEQYTR